MRNALAVLLFLVGSSSVFSQTVPAPATGTLVDLSAQASRAAPNDLFHATAFAEASDPNSATVARKVNQQIASALAVSKDFPSVRTRTGGTQTWPVYGKNERTLETWRMRSEIQLESQDGPALADLLGKLQNTLGISQMNATPSPETLRKAEADATIAAIQAFRERAGLIAGALGKKYKIRELNVGSSNPVFPMMRGKVMMAAEASPMPIEGGESQVMVHISGKIELTD
jgi:predicted secreted protein